MIVSDTGVEVAPKAKLAGVKAQAALAGKLVQLIVMVPVNAPYGVMLRLKLAG